MNRAKYLVVAIVLLGVDFYLRKISTDKFLNKYVFVACATLTIIMMLRILFQDGFVLLPVLVCGAGWFVECLKFFNLFYKAKLHKIPFLKSVVGKKFDFKLLLAYAIGAAIAVVLSRSDEY